MLQCVIVAHSLTLLRSNLLCGDLTVVLSNHMPMNTWVISFFGYYNEADINIHMQFFVGIYAFLSLKYILRNKIVGTYNSMYQYQIVLQICCTISHCYQQYMSTNCCLKNSIYGSYKSEDMFSCQLSSWNLVLIE